MTLARRFGTCDHTLLTYTRQAPSSASLRLSKYTHLHLALSKLSTSLAFALIQKIPVIPPALQRNLTSSIVRPHHVRDRRSTSVLRYP